MPEMAVPSLAPGAERRQRSPRLRPWLLLIALLLMGYCVASYGVWNAVTTDLLASAHAVAHPGVSRP